MIDNEDFINSAYALSQQAESILETNRIMAEKERQKEKRQEDLLSEVKKQNDLLVKQIQDANERAVKAEKSAKKSNIITIVCAVITFASLVVAIIK